MQRLRLAQFFGVPFNRFAIDEILIAAGASNAHTIEMSLFAKSLY
jgi:hypothetical protein